MFKDGAAILAVRRAHVRYWPLADNPQAVLNVRYWG